MVAKLHKLAERTQELAAKRVKDKDALDVLRILRAIPTKALAEGLGRLRADSLSGEVTREAENRTALASRILGGVLETPSFPASLHVWLPLTELDAERIAGRALRHGVALTPPSAMLVAGEHVAGLRLCLCTPPDLPTLDRALRVVASVMTTDPEGPSQSVI